ncbi:UDP-N-acetylmuramoyl-L-alanyl-D-glutamate--2,6-diaminopimelate ligase [Rarobacter faecitabidus]|uniref:UDP-N-acetylmuramyl-tripeptide synthetase n=1 Tax=Rarobacter faecitabidus TaxID=13243 RepID=A0A542ZWC1_RARFA|nr:UDP-N-acetylmuramoyl-L-alanyl-D-glutamate--2,6-diaminopimelate ligase [Rarobacter faecitabidus]TQL64622.1 UDP-N-acetylmuramoylalanyl-D-glutamate--2,6-diaminopimelate ligase [Rarobacter faecitabidus]
MTSDQGRLRPAAKYARSLGELVDHYADSLVLLDLTAREIQFTGLAVGTSDLLPGDVFIAFQGLKTHGARFAVDAQRAGAVAIITDDAGATLLRDEGGASIPVVVLRETSTQRALAGDIAAWFYNYPSRGITTVGVTGTNGKTTTTYFIDAALSGGDHTTALLGTVELRVGQDSIPSPRTTVEAPVLQAITAMASERGATALTTEVSSHALALDRVAGAKFDVVAFTNLQRDHLDFHGTMDNYFADKARLFAPGLARHGVVCVDDEWGVRLADNAPIPVDTVASRPGSPGYETAQWRVTQATIGLDNVGSSFRLVGPGGIEVTVHSPLPGLVNVSNAALAVVVAYRSGVELAAAARGIETITAIPGRMERVVDDADHPLVIVDYAHTPDALTLALEAVRPITAGRLVIVFGSDGDRDQGKRPIMGEIAARLADVLVVTDENPRSEDPAEIRSAILAGVGRVRPDLSDVVEVSPRWDAVARGIELAQPGDTVIITGKGHEPTQEIAGVFHPYNDRDAARAAVSADS